MSETERARAYHAALASQTRRGALEAIRGAPQGLDAASVAVRLGLHVTTARFHLDQLVTAGLATRRTGEEGRRGRPRVLYTPAMAEHEVDSRDALIEALATALTREPDGASAAESAGRQWAARLQADAGEAGLSLVAALDRVGFAPEPDAVAERGSEREPDAGARIMLTACPFREAAREHPEIVCAVHRGFVEQLSPTTAESPRLLPFVGPSLCVVETSRRSA